MKRQVGAVLRRSMLILVAGILAASLVVAGPAQAITGGNRTGTGTRTWA